VLVFFRMTLLAEKESLRRKASTTREHARRIRRLEAPKESNFRNLARRSYQEGFELDNRRLRQGDEPGYGDVQAEPYAKEKGKLIALCTNNLALADREVKSGNYDLAYEQLLKVYNLMSGAREYLGETLSLDSRDKLAQGLVNRVYRLSHKIEKNTRLDKDVDRLASDVKLRYGVKPYTPIKEAASMVASIAGIVGGLLYVFGGITGNVIGGASRGSGVIFGAVLFLIGVLIGGFSLKKRAY